MWKRALPRPTTSSRTLSRRSYQEQAFLEPEAGIAWVDEHDVINIRVSTQVVEHFRSIADALGLPHNKVHLKAEYVGGGFGGKENITVETYLALLALRARRPVKLVLPREEIVFCPTASVTPSPSSTRPASPRTAGSPRPRSR